MRNLTNEELAAVAGAGNGGGGGIHIGDIGSGNAVGNNNSVDASGNFSGNSLDASAMTHAVTKNVQSLDVKTLLNDIVGGIL